MKNKVMFLSVIAMLMVFLVVTNVWAKDKKIKMAVATQQSKKDIGWGQDMYDAYLNIKKHYSDFVDVTFSEKIPWGDSATFLKTQASMGTEILFLDSAQSWGEALKVVAPKNPGTWYICPGTDAFTISQMPPNVRGYIPYCNEGAFLAGVAAGIETKNNKVGFLGSMDYPSIISLSASFELGAKWINPNVKHFSQFVGSFMDAEKGYEHTTALIGSGVDVIFFWAGGSGLGGVKACKEKGVKWIGAAVDQAYLDPKTCITSILMNHSYSAALGLAEYRAGILKPGTLFIKLTSGIRHLSPLTNVSEDVKTKVAQARKAIASRQFNVPMIFDNKKVTHLSPVDYGIRSPKELGID